MHKCKGILLILCCPLWWDISTIRKKLLYVQLPCKPVVDYTRTCQCISHLPSSLNDVDKKKWLPVYCNGSHWQDPPVERNVEDVVLALAEGSNDTGVGHRGLPYSNGRRMFCSCDPPRVRLWEFSNITYDWFWPSTRCLGCPLSAFFCIPNSFPKAPGFARK